MADQVLFEDGVWYAARIDGSKTRWDESTRKRTPFLYVTFFITAGKPAGKDLVGEFYFSEGAIDRTQERLALLGVDVRSDDLQLVPKKLNGIECEVRCEIQKQEKYADKVRASDVRPKGAPGAGSIAMRIARAIGNTATTEVEGEGKGDDDFADQF